MNRRSFLFSTSIPATAVFMGGIPQGHSKPVDPIGTFKPFIQRDRLPNPVIIESLELYERGGDWFIRARSKDGAEGWSVGHPSKMELSQHVFTKVIAPYMRGKEKTREISINWLMGFFLAAVITRCKDNCSGFNSQQPNLRFSIY
ncbi:MAG TPA: hypothetical protein EYQ23_03125 [Verrucomicrobiales bacterium]|nr:hypothetical protein [Verrucomicrobiales bacterium]